MVYLVVRMKGTVNIPRWADLTLENLHLNKKFRATLIPENKETLGMLRKIKEIVSWTTVDENFMKEFIEKKGRVSSSKLLSDQSQTQFNEDISIDAKKNESPKVNLDNVVYTLKSNQTYLSKISGIKPWFALNPPKGGFKKKSKHSSTQDGILGENKDLISLVKRMM
jgi:large subunit ribosomal protein L30